MGGSKGHERDELREARMENAGMRALLNRLCIVLDIVPMDEDKRERDLRVGEWCGIREEAQRREQRPCSVGVGEPGDLVELYDHGEKPEVRPF